MNGFHDLVTLDAEECWQLLASVPIARVGLQVDNRIDVLPVNHTVVGRQVAWLSGAGTKLGAAAAELPVALEADGIDATGRRGWSVLVHGTARIVTEGSRQQQFFDAEVTPWVAPDMRTMWVEVANPTISGRRVT